MSAIKIHCDGGAFPNPGFAAWACVISPFEDVAISDKTIFFSGGMVNATNNQAELTGVLEALKYCKENNRTNVMIYSDSRYCVDIHNKWARGWAKLGWKRKKGEVKNIELVRMIYGLSQEVKSSMAWLKGHADDPFNCFADELCEKAIYNLTKEFFAEYNTTEEGDTLMVKAKDKPFAVTYRVQAVFPTSDTIVLEPVNNKFAKTLILSKLEFNAEKFIKL